MDPLTEAILELWNEGQMPDSIIKKLGLDLDPEVVEDIIEAPGNYALQLADF
jgi:hypothetical protein